MSRLPYPPSENEERSRFNPDYYRNSPYPAEPQQQGGGYPYYPAGGQTNYPYQPQQQQQNWPPPSQQFYNTPYPPNAAPYPPGASPYAITPPYPPEPLPYPGGAYGGVPGPAPYPPAPYGAQGGSQGPYRGEGPYGVRMAYGQGQSREGNEQSYPEASASGNVGASSDNYSGGGGGLSNIPVKNFLNQSYEELARGCQRGGTLFEDPEFPASNRLLTDDDNESQSIFSYSRHHRVEDDSIEWKRPSEICEDPQMFIGEVSRFDIDQGELGDCWFLAALAHLADNKQCFQHVVPADQGFGGGYCGIFRFRFWRFGEWIEIVIDDLLPTRDGKLIYLRSDKRNEFWSALMEKAYAKLHGSYKSLEGGVTIEAAVDFTGGIPEMIEISGENNKMSPDALFHVMSLADERGAFMGCALGESNSEEAKSLGLTKNHAYTITKVVDLRRLAKRSGGVPLIRIRNPHGNYEEWKGEWSDKQGDPNWQTIPSDVRESIGLVSRDDGEFYMSFRDYMRYYGDAEICHLSPLSAEDSDDNSSMQFEVFKFFGSWKEGTTAGGCGNDGRRHFAKNPQFFVNLTKPNEGGEAETHCPLIVSLSQRQVKRNTELAIGFKIYACENEEEEARQLSVNFLEENECTESSDTFINMREISKRMQLPQGRYCIIPCTFNQGEEGDFLLRVFVEKRWGSSNMGRGEAITDTMDEEGGTGGGPQGYGGRGEDSSRGNVEGGGGERGEGGSEPGGSSEGEHQHHHHHQHKDLGTTLKELEDIFPYARGLKKLEELCEWSEESRSEFRKLDEIMKPPHHHHHHHKETD